MSHELLFVDTTRKVDINRYMYMSSQIYGVDVQQRVKDSVLGPVETLNNDIVGYR